MNSGKRNADRTREKILRAAIGEFATHGYSGARVERIRQRARANTRMIYHYFGDKSRLYVAVLEQCVIGELRLEGARLEVDQVDQIDPVEGLLLLFDFIDQHFTAHPELMTLLSGENLLRGRFLRSSAKTPIITSPLMPLMEQLLRRGERRGADPSGRQSPSPLRGRMVALCYFHRSNAHTLSFLFLHRPPGLQLAKRAQEDGHRSVGGVPARGPGGALARTHAEPEL